MSDDDVFPVDGEVELVPITEIAIGDRARKDNGDIQALAESLNRVGMLHPVICNSQMQLIAGGRRIHAAKYLHWKTVPVRRVNKLDDAMLAIIAEMDENHHREPMKPSEINALGKMLEAIEKPKAEKIKLSNLQQNAQKCEDSPKAKISHSGNGGGRVSQTVAKAGGVSDRTYEKIREVSDAAEKDPEAYGDLPAKMDETGKVDPAHKEMKERKKAESRCPQGIVIPKAKQATFAILEKAKEAKRLYRQIAALLDEMARAPGGEFLSVALQRKGRGEEFTFQCPHLRDSMRQLEFEMPDCCVCPYCEAKHSGKTDKKCSACHGRGWIRHGTMIQSLPPEMKEHIEALAAKDGDE